MARKPRNRDFEESVSRLEQAFQQREFKVALDMFKTAWANRNYPSIGDDRYIDWDYSKHQTVYYGLYYDLRNLCDRFHLLWPIDGDLLLRRLYADKESDNTYLKPEDCPSKRDWQRFRMAHTGFGRPRDEEIVILREIGRGVNPHRESERLFNKGLTYMDIAELEGEGITERTIFNSIKRCRRYLQNKGINLNQIAELMGIEEEDFFKLLTFTLGNRLKDLEIPEK